MHLRMTRFKEETLTVTVLYIIGSGPTRLLGLPVCEYLGPVNLKIRAGVTCGRRAHLGNSRIHNIATVTGTI